MKTFAFLSVINASQDLRACPDQELGDQCVSNCQGDLSTCLASCSDASCQEQCYNNFNTCSFRCPCNIFCPEGCKDCDNPICPEDGCPDQVLADECEGKCSAVLGSCLSGCSSADCQEDCFNSYNNCSFRCPCNIFCPNGCEGCDNEICGDGTCPDQDLLEICEANCNSTLQICMSGCSGAQCQEDCYHDFVTCEFHCPCNAFCPSGCDAIGCDAPICGGDGGSGGSRRIVHLGDPESTDKTVFFATDEWGEIFENLSIQLPESGSNSFTVLNGAGYVVYKNEVYAFGGYTTYGVPKTRILKLVGCEFQVQSAKLRYDFSTSYGSIAVWDGGKWEPEGVYICFGSFDGGKRCERFDGTESVYSSTSRKSHRDGSVCIYDGKLLAIGGTNDDANYTEMFSWEWNPAIPHPEGHSYAPCVTVDEGVLLFSRSSAYNSKVWLFSNFEWSEVGGFPVKASWFTALPLDNNTIMMYPGEVGKAAYRTVWNGEEIVESTKMLDDGELRYDRTMKPIVFQGVLDCPVTV
ncbi:Oidioi.mRNA.OKI2018_I69.chr2.g4490.t1.cds [Oikopleura dioica]|uniref:Oidioi.mRNA.OKI2018_I69.chr2.g4490.t1.cds n=1 Tax=Oikopleura dioica TaxID=34765 RepID=A0ABN7T330_OIKDI|nr:Oidioi.mRNA.OKI2018_I69.chr2.g4490.t1.cds [Oikopleura dioica]